MGEAAREVTTVQFAAVIFFFIVVLVLRRVYITEGEARKIGGDGAIPDVGTGTGSATGLPADTKEEGIGMGLSGMLIIFMILFGLFLSITTARKFLGDAESAELLRKVNYDPSRFPRVAKYGAKHGLKGLHAASEASGAAASAAAGAAFKTMPGASEYWRDKFRGPKGEEKLKKFLDPGQTKTRKLLYHEPGAASTGMAVLMMGRQPGFQLKQKDISYNTYEHARQEDLAKRARLRAEEGWAKEHAPSPAVARALEAPDRSTYAPPPLNLSMPALPSSLPGAMALFGGAWFLAMVLIAPRLEPVAHTVLQVSGAGILGLLTYFVMSDKQFPYETSLFVSVASTGMLYAISTAF